MGCNVSGDTLQYRLQESVTHRPTQQMTQLLTYLLMHNLFSYCIRRYLVSRALNWVITVCRVTYFQFLIQSAFLQYITHKASPGLHRNIGFNMQYWALDFAKNMGKYLSCTECTSHGKEFVLILMVKMETRHPIQGAFGSKFPAICNHCAI